ncbi:MAG: hypothetical protein ABI231_05120 [Candidatus Tumulicola sp.]
MRVLRSLLTIAILVAPLLPGSAPAQTESTPIPAVVKPNFSSMDFLVGTWACSTKSSRRPGPYQTISTYALDPSGYWMNETSTTKPTAWVSTQLTVTDKITYDPDSKRWVDVLSGDQGAYGLSFSKGWAGNHMTWHDVSFAPGPNIHSQTDMVATKVSNTKVTSSSTFTETKTGRKVTVAAICTKE